MNTKGVKHSMQGVFVFVLLGLFALMSTLMVLLGAQMYRKTVDNASDNNNNRVLSAYVRSMVRALDTYDAVRIEEHEGITAIALYDSIDEMGDSTSTWIYLYDGYVRENYVISGIEFDPEDGEQVAPANKFEPVLQGGLLTVEMANEYDEPSTVNVALRCAQPSAKE